MKYSSVGCFLSGSFLLRVLELSGVVSSSPPSPLVFVVGWLVWGLFFGLGLLGVFGVFFGMPMFKPVSKFRIKIELCVL